MPESTTRGRLYLVRHGLVDWNAADRLATRTDRPLSWWGQRQARTLGNRLREVAFNQAFSSPRERARRTADLICAAQPVPIAARLDERLVEVDAGPFEGWTERQLGADPLAVAWQAGSPVDGAETEATAAARASAVFRDLAALSGTTLVVSHGHFLRFLVGHCVLGLTLPELRRLTIRNCAPAIVEVGPQPVLLTLNARGAYRESGPTWRIHWPW